MSASIDISELPDRLDEALAIVSSGAEVLLTDGATPRARLVPYEVFVSRTPGLHLNAIQTTEDFDAPLPEEFWAGQS